MPKRIYMQDTYKLDHMATVVATGLDDHGTWVSLSETIFHPQGGGQPSDIGEIQGVKVTMAKNVSDDVRHYVEDVSQFVIGNPVTLKVDAETRIINSARHTAGHLLAAILEKEYGFHNQKSADHFPGRCSVKFPLNGRVPTATALIEKVNEAITLDLPVEEKYIEGERHLQIEGYRCDRCGGPLLSTVGQLTDISIRNIKTKKRVLSVGYEVSYSPELVTKAAFESIRKKSDGDKTDDAASAQVHTNFSLFKKDDEEESKAESTKNPDSQLSPKP
jgi:Ser-tRNA(Ala) deacylase AlaX